MLVALSMSTRTSQQFPPLPRYVGLPIYIYISFVSYSISVVHAMTCDEGGGGWKSERKKRLTHEGGFGEKQWR